MIELALKMPSSTGAMYQAVKDIKQIKEKSGAIHKPENLWRSGILQDCPRSLECTASAYKIYIFLSDFYVWAKDLSLQQEVLSVAELLNEIWCYTKT